MLDMVPSDVIDISVVVTFEDSVVVKYAGVVALKLVAALLPRSGNVNEKERGTRSRVSIIIVSTL